MRKKQAVISYRSVLCEGKNDSGVNIDILCVMIVMEIVYERHSEKCFKLRS